MKPLPAYVAPEPLVVLCGLAGVGSRRSRQHYYETPGNAFWELLHDSGLCPERLGPADDARLPAYGLGVTDLIGHHDGERWVHDVDALAADVARWRPEWLALTSKTVAGRVARALRERPPGLGPSDLELGGAPIFVLPGPSGAKRRADYDGRPDRLSWWSDLASLVGRGRDTPPG